jgi:uncharacterized peroxidase-related enzyme
MAFIKTISEDLAEGLLHEQYKAARESLGYVPNYIQTLSLRPDVYDAWQKLIGSIRSKMRLRRYELVTFAAAMALNCTYCRLAHGAILRKNFFSAEQLVAIVKDFRGAGLPAEEVALMAFAQKVITQATQLGEEDFAALRGYGLSDEEIMDVVLTATARSFFSKTLDSAGAQADPIYHDLEPELVQALIAGGRPFPQ